MNIRVELQLAEERYRSSVKRAREDFTRVVAEAIDSQEIKQGEVAELFGVSRETVRLWTAEGRRGTL